MKSTITILIIVLMILITGCGAVQQMSDSTEPEETVQTADVIPSPDDIDFGTEVIRGFTFDNVLHSENNGDIHFGLYIPDTYDGSEPYALYVTLPGYEGLYFQGVGVNIQAEDYGTEAQKYIEKMIIVAPQLNDWGETSADQTVALTEYFIDHYNIDTDKVYLNGYSGGGETGSLVMEKAPGLYTAFLHCSSQWDGDLEPLVNAETPVYMATGEDDSYYGSSSVRETYEKLVNMYRDKGLTEDRIKKLAALDLKDQAWFDERGITDQHGGGGYFAHDESIMGWLFGDHSMSGAPSIEQTGWTESVPADYRREATEQGSIVSIEYKSKDYSGDGLEVNKTAYVYLPYGYDENDLDTRYNIIYLMHGWGGHAGEYFEYGAQKNIYDNLIEKGDMEPMIIVSVSFYNERSDYDFGSSVSAFRAFHNEFENDLMPAVEGTYHTYAKSPSDEDLKQSRNHRAFGGFSLGSVTTWLQFCYDYDYIKYFLPMSGSSWYYGTYGDFQIEKNVDFIEQLVNDNDLDERGYFIYHAVGTRDTVKSQTLDMADEMLKRDTFTTDHYVFYQREGGQHDFDSVQEFLYNALPLFFR